MAVRTRSHGTDDLDGLRLLALGRIPRCSSCPRFRSLVAAHERGFAVAGEPGAVPAHCRHEVCAPLVARCRPATRPTSLEPEIAPSALRLRAS